MPTPPAPAPVPPAPVPPVIPPVPVISPVPPADRPIPPVEPPAPPVITRAEGEEIGLRAKRIREEVAAQRKKAADDAAAKKLADEAAAAAALNPPPPAPPAPPAAPPVAPPSAAPKPVAKPVLPTPEDFVAPVEAPAAPAAPTLGFTPTADEADYFETLRFAEISGKAAPGTVAAEAAKFAAARTAADQARTQWQQENPGERFDPRTAELQDGRRVAELGQVERALSPSEIRRLERAESDARADAKIAKAKSDLQEENERRIRSAELRGTIASAKEAVAAQILKLVPLDEDPEVDADLKKGGVAVLATDLPFEGHLIAEATAVAERQTVALLEVLKGAVRYDPANADHVHAGRVVTESADWFARHGGAERVRDGKTFVTPADFAKIKPEKKAMFFTFTHEQMTGLIADVAARKVAAVIKSAQESQKKSAEARNRVKAQTKPIAPAVQPPKPPPTEIPPDPVKLASSPVPTPNPTSSTLGKSFLLPDGPLSKY